MKFKILSIDGGGIRGIFPAHILSCISTRLHIPMIEKIQLITGTSTGSIIAAGLACGIDADKIVALYRKKGESIFTPRFSFFPRFIRPMFHSVYNNNPLYEELTNIFQDIKLGDIKTPLIIPATDIGNGSVHVFKSKFSNEFTRDENVYVRDAVMASCSAPTFLDPTTVNEYLLADGGLWANNPSLIGMIDAQRRLGVSKCDIQILSIGTGHAKKAYGTEAKKNWGFMCAWKRKEFVNFIMSLQAQATYNYLQLMLEKEQILRLNFETDKMLPMDDCSIINDIVSRADQIFTYNTRSINNFFEIN
jgi:patatin-like phospholipase/acyl hydrolase